MCARDAAVVAESADCRGVRDRGAIDARVFTANIAGAVVIDRAHFAAVAQPALNRFPTIVCLRAADSGTGHLVRIGNTAGRAFDLLPTIIGLETAPTGTGDRLSLRCAAHAIARCGIRRAWVRETHPGAALFVLLARLAIVLAGVGRRCAALSEEANPGGARAKDNSDEPTSVSRNGERSS